ncbi:MAG: tetratricopeptide repeat protein, partial [Candidatus Acidiferrales bacterium]
LVLGPAPKFEISLPRAHVPPDAWPLLDFVPLLRTFYQQADLAGLRKQALPRYDRVVAARGEEVGRQLSQTRGYLRLIGEYTPGRTYSIYLEWLVPPSLVSARSYGENYVLVLHPNRADLLEAVRHQYLHFLLDPVTAKYASNMSTMGRLQSVVAQAPRLAADFRHDTLLLVTESLIQAVELRLQKLQPAAAAARLQEIERTGFIFARHFYAALDGFEQAEPSIRFYFPELLLGYDLEQERQRLTQVDFAAAPAFSGTLELTPDEENEPVKLLAEGEGLLSQGDYPAARAVFVRVLHEFDPENAAAFFGLGIVASAEQDSETAKENFERVLAGNPEGHISGWAHIYLGRIYDLEGNRERALEHYRAALALDTRQERIERAARRGLAQPFEGQ